MTKFDAVRSNDASRIGVVIVSYDSSCDLKKSLSTIAASGFDVVVVENSMSTATRPACLAAGAMFLHRPDNPGFGASCNYGASRLDTEYVLFLNPDCFASGPTILDCVRVLESESTIGIVGPRLIRSDGALDLAAKRKVVRPLDAFLHLTSLRVGPGETYSGEQLDHSRSERVDAINGAFMLMRLADFRYLNGFSGGYWMYMEDIDICVRMREDLGLDTYFLSTAIAVHRKHSTTGSARRPLLNYHFFRSAWVFYLRHQSTDDNVITRATVFAGLVVYGSARTLNDSARRLAQRWRAR